MRTNFIRVTVPNDHLAYYCRGKKKTVYFIYKNNNIQNFKFVNLKKLRWGKHPKKLETNFGGAKSSKKLRDFPNF